MDDSSCPRRTGAGSSLHHNVATVTSSSTHVNSSTELEELAPGFSFAASEISKTMKQVSIGVSATLPYHERHNAITSTFSDAKTSLDLFSRTLSNNRIIHSLESLITGPALPEKSVQIVRKVVHSMKSLAALKGDLDAMEKSLISLISYLQGQLDLALSTCSKIEVKTEDSIVVKTD